MMKRIATDVPGSDSQPILLPPIRVYRLRTVRDNGKILKTRFYIRLRSAERWAKWLRGNGYRVYVEAGLFFVFDQDAAPNAALRRWGLTTNRDEA